MNSAYPLRRLLFYTGITAVAFAIWYIRSRPVQSTSPAAPVAATPAAAPAGTATPARPVQSGTVAPATPVAIQDNKTIDFSSGRPVVRDSANEKAIIDAAVKEMDEAAAGITFGPAKK